MGSLQEITIVDIGISSKGNQRCLSPAYDGVTLYNRFECLSHGIQFTDLCI